MCRWGAPGHGHESRNASVLGGFTRRSFFLVPRETKPQSAQGWHHTCPLAVFYFASLKVSDGNPRPAASFYGRSEQETAVAHESRTSQGSFAMAGFR